jgi:ribosomal protein S18 acetylase RimI-like enzyme
MNIKIRPVVIEDYDMIYALWNNTEQTRRAMNPVDDSRDGIERYLKRNPTTCFLAYDSKDDKKIAGVILSGHDGRRAIIHHLCVHPDFRRQGVARMLVQKAEEALRKEGITKVIGLVFKDNNVANEFWDEQGYTIRPDLNYRNKSLHKDVPQDA